MVGRLGVEPYRPPPDPSRSNPTYWLSRATFRSSPKRGDSIRNDPNLLFIVNLLSTDLPHHSRLIRREFAFFPGGSKHAEMRSRDHEVRRSARVPYVRGVAKAARIASKTASIPERS